MDIRYQIVLGLLLGVALVVLGAFTERMDVIMGGVLLLAFCIYYGFFPQYKK